MDTADTSTVISATDYHDYHHQFRANGTTQRPLPKHGNLQSWDSNVVEHHKAVGRLAVSSCSARLSRT